MYAFVVFPREARDQARVFFSKEYPTIADITFEDLEELISLLFSCEKFDLEDLVFHEMGEYKPITFDKNVSYTINQE